MPNSAIHAHALQFLTREIVRFQELLLVCNGPEAHMIVERIRFMNRCRERLKGEMAEQSRTAANGGH